MKKLVMLVCSLAMVFSLVACGAPSNEVNVKKFPNAVEYQEFSWPTFGLASKLPTPSWSNRGEVGVDSAYAFSADIGYTTIDDYDTYIKACYDLGYTEDYFTTSFENTRSFSASTAEGYYIFVTLDEGYVMTVNVTAPEIEFPANVFEVE